MCFKLQNVPGIVSRKPPKTLKGKTLFGKEIVLFKNCNTCDIKLPISAFYKETNKRSRYGDATRKQCVTCWQ